MTFAAVLMAAAKSPVSFVVISVVSDPTYKVTTVSWCAVFHAGVGVSEVSINSLTPFPDTKPIVI